MGDGKTAQLRVEVAYALPECQALIALEVEEGTTVGQAIALSGIRAEHPEIDTTGARIGIFGRLVPLDTVLREHDRVEIYRALRADPKEARRRRAGTGTRRGKKR
jgi:putative ubiquitin-RnfH superfamily antitoxin RatB of RatAB toxin-antitoxin module